mgnify:CR=1 FL=1
MAGNGIEEVGRLVHPARKVAAVDGSGNHLALQEDTEVEGAAVGTVGAETAQVESMALATGTVWTGATAAAAVPVMEQWARQALPGCK